MYIITQGIYALFSVIGFSIIFNLPRKLIPYAGVTGMIGWMVYVTLQGQTSNFILPAVVGSVAVGLIGEILAAITRHPSTMFTIPGIIPFVPGYGIYYTMLYIVQKDFDQAMTTGAQSLFVAISIACGVLLATSLMRFIRPSMDKWLEKIR
ncbi:threonine/serine exporter family protein [Fusibacter ferrireducens]|uniref:Threonine/serine exporter family protein n=1 Tax=Fusibacter ferrireducens TaxID=2785058 RepID=A0ABR9ZMH2_9FIRM|nr:threonine/serine exporter family protein [Fusibacter ferrireducens]MBF4691655.1 threonine/serine exporter family protein [Fusibacter ferrireducens]